MPNKIPKIGIFFDYDITIRHFLLNDTFRELGDEYQLVYVFNIAKDNSKTGIFYDVSGIDKISKRFIHVPRRRMGRWYHLFIPELLSRHRKSRSFSAIIDQAKLNHSSKLFLFYRLVSLPVLKSVFKYMMTKWMGKCEELEDLLIEENFDVIIHPSLLAGFLINDLILSTSKLSIPFIVAMNSWDNPSNKAMAIGCPDVLCVWGEQSRLHAIEYLGAKKDRVKILGAAQFEPHKSEPSIPECDVYTKFGLENDSRPVILYAGAAKSLNETEHLRTIENAIELGLLPAVQVLYRPHPWRGGLSPHEKSFFDFQFKHVVLDPTLERFYSEIVTTHRASLFVTDVQDTRDLLSICDGIISPLSTLILEGCIHGIPALALFTDSEADTGASQMQQIVAKLPYFEHLVDCKGIVNCDDFGEFVSNLRELLSVIDDEDVANELRRHSEYFVSPRAETYGSQLRTIVGGQLDSDDKA